MTTQSLPISKTRKDIIIAVVISLLIIGGSSLAVYYARPGGLIMRQPRMTFVLLYAVVVGAICFGFLKKEATGYISRPLAWGFCVVDAIGMGAFYFFTDQKTKNWGFKATLFVLVFSLSATLLCEIIIFYRKKMSQKSRNNIFHQLIFAIVCAAYMLGVGYLYCEKAVHGGAILTYQKAVTPTLPNPSVSIPSTPDSPVVDSTPTTVLDTTVTTAAQQ